MDFLSADSLPWLQGSKQRLREAQRAGRLPHALLLLSTPGLGAEQLANWITAFVLCESAGQRPCGTCASCGLLRADTHPDSYVVRLEEDAQQIKIDQIRDLIESLTLRSYRGGYKVAVIEGAEALNVSGANAFLKTLEEPTPDTLLIMIAQPSHRLPATIASRCLRLPLRPPPTALAVEWLQACTTARVSSGEDSSVQSPTAPGSSAQRSTIQGLSATGLQPEVPVAHGAARAPDWVAALKLVGGAPLRALGLGAAIAELDTDMLQSVEQLARAGVDVTLLAERWIRSDPALRITWLENWVTQRIRTALIGADSSESAEPARLPGALLKPKIRALFELLDAAREWRRLASTSLNQQLALEALLLGGRNALANQDSSRER